MIHAGQVIVKILPNSRFKASMLTTRRNDHQTNSLHKHQQMYTSLHREFVFLHRYYAIWVKQPLSTCPSPSSWIRLSAQVARNWPRVQEAWKLDNNGYLFSRKHTQIKTNRKTETKTSHIFDDATVYWRQMTQTPSLDKTTLRVLHSKTTRIHYNFYILSLDFIAGLLTKLTKIIAFYSHSKNILTGDKNFSQKPSSWSILQP